MRALRHIVRLPGALPLDAAVSDYSAVGDGLHAFFACDVDGLLADERVARARRLIDAHDLGSCVRAEALVEASDRLRAFVDVRWPGAIWRREVPVEGYVGRWSEERLVTGVIDLLLETNDRFVVIDHKTFPGREEAAWRAKCPAFAPQIDRTREHAFPPMSIGGPIEAGRAGELQPTSTAFSSRLCQPNRV